MIMMIIIIIIIKSGNSLEARKQKCMYITGYNIIIIQFSSLLFMCRVNSYKANYRNSTV
jgi:hypothetical protein